MYPFKAYTDLRSLGACQIGRATVISHRQHGPYNRTDGPSQLRSATHRGSASGVNSNGSTSSDPSPGNNDPAYSTIKILSQTNNDATPADIDTHNNNGTYSNDSMAPIATASSSSQPSQNHNSSSSSSRSRSGNSTSSKTAVVIGGGWAGFGAALALAKAGAKVTLLDAAENPGGLSSAFKTAGGQLVEPGIKGFWYQYSNIEALVSELGIPSPFTPFTRSSFWSPDGLQVESPIFQDLPRLPTPLGSFIHTAPLFRSLSLLDRATATPLVKPLLEHDLDDELYTQYDTQSAYELFKSAGVSKQLYEKFLAPMLLVTLFAPPTELSAAAALGALYYFALAHQPDFDVRWCKGPIGELIFTPLVDKLKSLGVQVLGGRRVLEIRPIQNPNQPAASQTLNPNQPGSVVTKTLDGSFETHSADVIVLAAGVPALQSLVRQSPVLAAAHDLRSVMSVSCSDVLAVRLWLEQKLDLRSASNVVAGFDEGVGGTFFQLDKLQEMYKGQAGSVLEFDMYHAEPLLPMSDDDIINRMLQTYLAPALANGAAQASTLRVKDASVLRFRNAVTRFSPGSHAMLPGICTSIPNVFVAGDCVKQGPGTHGCKGLSQEKAYVSGLQAGNRAAARLGLAPVSVVIPVEPDEPHVIAAKTLLQSQRQLQKLQNTLFSAATVSRTTAADSRSSYVRQAPDRERQAGRGRSSSWHVEANESEKRAQESHELQQLLKQEVVEQVEQQVQHEHKVTS